MQILNYYANESRHQISILAPRAIFWLLLNYILYIIFYICILGLMRTFKICFKYNFPSFLLFYISVIKSYLQSSHLFVAVLSLVILYQILYFHCFWIMLGAQWDRSNTFLFIFFTSMAFNCISSSELFCISVLISAHPFTHSTNI